jgi:hypothetical protein
MTIFHRPEEIEDELVRSSDEAGRSRIWAELVAKIGPEEASRRWLEIFAASDASETG